MTETAYEQAQETESEGKEATPRGPRRRHQSAAEQDEPRPQQAARRRRAASPEPERQRRQGAGKRGPAPSARQQPQQQQRDRPSMSTSDVAQLDESSLMERASMCGVDAGRMSRDEIVAETAAAIAESEGFKVVTGTLRDDPSSDMMSVRTGSGGYGDGRDDAYMSQRYARGCGFRPGDMVTVVVGSKRAGQALPPSVDTISVNGSLVCGRESQQRLRERPDFDRLTPIYPDEKFTLAIDSNDITGRMLDLIAPIGKGQRAMIVAPPKAGKTTMMKSICRSIAHNSPDTHIMCLLIDERPEEVTDMRRSVEGEVIASTFDKEPKAHTIVAEQCLERAKRLVEEGRDVVVVMDSLTRLARAYNMATSPSGRVLSGGMDAAAIYPPKKFFGAARNVEGGGSLTIIATALVETNSKMDEVTFEELKGTGNMEVKLDRYLADKRKFPAIDIRQSGTRNEERLFTGQDLALVWRLRQAVIERERPMQGSQRDVEGPWNVMVNSMRQTENNAEFLVRFLTKQQEKSGIGM